MPLRTGATPQLDAPEVSAVVALIAATPPMPHDFGGVLHNADTLADVNAKVSDADMVALAGQIGGSAATPDIRGIRETGGPTLVAVGDIPDGSVVQRIGSGLVGGNLFAASIGSGGNYADLKAALAAYVADSSALDARLLLTGDITVGSSDANEFERGWSLVGTKGTGTAQAKLTLNNSVSMNAPVAEDRTTRSLENLHILANVAGKQLINLIVGSLTKFERCLLETSAPGTLVLSHTATGKATYVFFDCEFKAGDAADTLIQIGGATSTVQLIFINCREAAGSAAGKLIKTVAGIQTMDVVMIGSRFSSLGIDNVGAADVLNFRRDSASDYPESLITGAGNNNIVRVGGDQLRETGGPTLLDLGAIPDGEHVKRSGGSLVGELLGSFRLLNSLAHSATTGQGTDDHHAKLHSVDHGPGGVDALRLDNLEVPEDNTDLDVSTSAHGLMPKLPNDAEKFIDGVGTYVKKVFGDGEEFAISDGESTTASTTLQSKLSHTTPSLPAGTYRVGFSAEVTNGDGDKEMAYRFRIGATVEGDGEPANKNGDDYQSVGAIAQVTLGAPATITADIFFSSTSNGGTAKIRKARIEIWRVS